MTLGIHTVYKPQENFFQLEDWLTYHSHIGFKKFYMYDNGDSFADSHRQPYDAQPTKSKYGYSYPIDLGEARKKQDKIFAKYDVELVRWSPADDLGKVVYGQLESMRDCILRVDRGLIAFIDIDEFIIKKEPFFPSRMRQKKYDHIAKYKSVSEINLCIDQLAEIKWGSKCILDSQEFNDQKTVTDLIQSPHLESVPNLLHTKNYFNHYNYNEFQHEFFVRKNASWALPGLEIIDYPEILKPERSPNNVIIVLGN